MYQSSDQNNLTVQVLLAALAMILAVVCWFQVAG
jgi:hypothetical protein